MVGADPEIFVDADGAYDHPRIEHMLFDGARSPIDGRMKPDLGRPGLGLELKEADARRYAV